MLVRGAPRISIGLFTTFTLNPDFFASFCGSDLSFFDPFSSDDIRSILG
jgi:hypothetical protein